MASYKNVTTPAGILLGMLAVRGALPEKFRSPAAYAAGGGIGGAGGYVAGGYLDAYGDDIKQTVSPSVSGGVKGDLKKLRKLTAARPGGQASADEIALINKLLGQKDFDTGLGVGDVSPVNHYAPHKSDSLGLRESMYQRRFNQLRNSLSQRALTAQGDTKGAATSADAADASSRQSNSWSKTPDAGILTKLLGTVLQSGAHVLGKDLDVGTDVARGAISGFGAK